MFYSPLSLKPFSLSFFISRCLSLSLYHSLSLSLYVFISLSPAHGWFSVAVPAVILPVVMIQKTLCPLRRSPPASVHFILSPCITQQHPVHTHTHKPGLSAVHAACKVALTNTCARMQAHAHTNTLTHTTKHISNEERSQHYLLPAYQIRKLKSICNFLDIHITVYGGTNPIKAHGRTEKNKLSSCRIPGVNHAQTQHQHPALRYQVGLYAT